ncbi:hypothetical protein OS493_038599 [Desmophyllum pertusum]|uniref:Uncharacterized protein n=1 Tax=Desmophyllum pertusum TaxID=174260 RepID=A0A9X0CDG8_9CNID|nr:hypothetical protein OS493_038599 [Desmophyllum pertusum]
MQSSNNRKGIEERLANCEKVLRLLLQVSLASFNSSHLEQKEEKQTREACKNASTAGDAVRLAAKILFSEQELLECSVRGRHTNKTVEQRKALDVTRLNYLTSTVTKVFPKTEAAKIFSILADFLKKTRARDQVQKKKTDTSHA